MNTHSALGIGVPINEAEKVRLRFLKYNLLNPQLKPLKIDNFIFFPIINSKSIYKLLLDIDYRVKECAFIKRDYKTPIVETLKTEFSDLKMNKISSKFDQFGEIAVLKLDQLKTSFQFRRRVGELILTQFPRIHTVLNKSDTITGTERIFPIEYLAGERKTHTWHHEYKLSIFLDLKYAYFNPRLAEEHNRIASTVSDKEKILDLFTGVGPFALHCAKKANCTVIAVDINPYAVYALKKSMKKNKLLGTVIPIIGDSRNIFIKKKYFNRIIINLPKFSIDYLPYATELIKKYGIITFYQFISKSDNPKSDIRKLIAAKMAKINSYKELFIKIGREVSPSKVQMNVDLQIT